MSNKLETLRSKKTSLLAASLTLVEGGLKTEAERSRNADYLSQIDEVQGQIDLNEKLNRKMAQFGITATTPVTPVAAPAIRTEPKSRTTKAERRALNHAFASYLRGKNVPAEYRDVVGSVTAGESLLPEIYNDVLIYARKQYAKLVDLATVTDNVTLAGFKSAYVNDFSTTTGLKILNSDGGDTTTSGQSVDPVFASQTTMLDFTTSGEILFSRQLAADSKFDLGALLKKLTAVRVARGIESLVVSGKDSFGTASTNQASLKANLNVAVTTASVAANVTAANILSLIESLDAAYTDPAEACIFMTAKTRLALLSQADTTGKLFWTSSSGEESGYRFFGYKTVITNSLDELGTASGIPILFGVPSAAISIGLSRLYIRLLVERYAEFNLVGLLPSIAVGSALIDTNAMASIKLAAS
jgi:HK97 family phage major capsid protein